MSIFKKDCPECAASNSMDAVRCSCGYCFDPDALAGADADAYAEEQSRLYVDYLGARIVQAEAELTVARTQAQADPANTYQAAAALLAEQTLNALRAEMKQLTLRRTAKRPTASAAHLPAASRTEGSATKTASGTKRSTPTVKAPAPVAHPTAGTHTPTAPQRLSSSSHPATQPAAQSPRSSAGATKTAAAAIEARPAEARDSSALKAHRPQDSRAVLPTPSQPPSAKPSANFRKVQARKADAIAKSQTFAPIAKVKPARASVAATTTPAPAALPKTASATRECPSCAAVVAGDLAKCRCGYAFTNAAAELPGVSLAILKTAGKEATQECPNCTASVPASRDRCNCGYTFPKPEQVPALTLDATALAILTEGIKPKNNSRRR